MRLSQATDDGLRLCLYLGAHPDQPMTILEAACVFGMRPRRFETAAERLLAGGFLARDAGKKTLRLTSPPQDLTIGALARCLQGVPSVVDCTDCLLQGSCELVRLLEEARQAFYRVLDTLTLAQAVTANPRTLMRLLGGAPPAGCD